MYNIAPTFTRIIFTLEKYPRSEVNKDYLVYSVKHKVSETSEEEPLYQNTIMVISSSPSSTFRSPSITPKLILLAIKEFVLRHKDVFL